MYKSLLFCVLKSVVNTFLLRQHFCFISHCSKGRVRYDQDQGKAWLSITNGRHQFRQKFSPMFGRDQLQHFKNKSQHFVMVIFIMIFTICPSKGSFLGVIRVIKPLKITKNDGNNDKSGQFGSSCDFSKKCQSKRVVVDHLPNGHSWR